VACFEFTAFDCRDARAASGMGQSRHFELAQGTSASLPIPDISAALRRSDEQHHVDLYADHCFR